MSHKKLLTVLDQAFLTAAHKNYLTVEYKKLLTAECKKLLDISSLNLKIMILTVALSLS